jgi:hypothetical protein
MKKTLIALALASISTAAFATGSDATVYANSQTSTYAQAGNGGTSHSTAGNFAVGAGDTDSNVRRGMLSVTVPNCNVPTTATVFGDVTTVTGEASTMGGSFAKNVSTGNGTGEAHALGVAVSDVAKTRNGVGGTASALTKTWANAGTDQSHSSFASQSANFEAQGATGLLIVTHDETASIHHHTVTIPHVDYVGVGAASTGTSDVPAAHQVYSLSNGGCHGGCQTGPGNDDAGSYTNANATTLTNVTYGNIPQ